jgi:hypothetical protein
VNSPYWKEMEAQPSYREWREFFEGCIACSCDHGCNEWILEQSKKAMLFLRIMHKNSPTSLDKLARMSLQRADKIFYRVQRWDMEKYNRKLKSE